MSNVCQRITSRIVWPFRNHPVLTLLLVLYMMQLGYVYHAHVVNSTPLFYRDFGYPPVSVAAYSNPPPQWPGSVIPILGVLGAYPDPSTPLRCEIKYYGSTVIFYVEPTIGNPIEGIKRIMKDGRLTIIDSEGKELAVFVD